LVTIEKVVVWEVPAVPVNVMKLTISKSYQVDKSIVRKFRHSTEAKSMLMKAQEREGMPQHTLIIV